jgi:late competence protein required for DNA uptake (superfamily II DNA/RNA helicase)
MKCKRCNRQLSDNESYEYLGEILCEDCYIDKYQASITACDPLAVHAATRSRKKLGLEGAQGLTDQQRAIYEFVKNQGRATREEIMQKLNLTGSQMQAQLAILRHCQLVKGQKEGNQIYLVPFS